MKLSIKNMVCNRCIKVVKEELEKLGYSVKSITLGEVTIDENPSETELKKIKSVLEENGFELLSNSKSKVIEKIKSTIIKLIHYTEADDKKDVVFSTEIEKALNLEYHYLSSLFSSIENITIEQYTILQKVERAKELLKYDELTLSEIAYKLGYSSVQHLSSQFKKTTGFTASQYKNLTNDLRKPLDSVQ